MSLSIPKWHPHSVGPLAMLAVTIVCGLPITSGAREAAAQEPAEQINAIARAQFEAGRFHGGLLVTDGSQVLYRGAFGSSDLGQETPNSADAPFPIRSITKSFTAVLILQLVQEGALDLDGTVGDYLTAFASTPAGRITLHHLLSHTSGLPDYILEIPGYMDYQPPNVSADSAMAFVLRLPLEFEPGAGYAYSKTGYVLLGMIVERMTGKSYGVALEERILRPLGMADTRWTEVETASGMPRQFRPGGAQEAPAIRHLPGDAGIMSTLDDMHRFASALGSPRLLSPVMWDRAFSAYAHPENVTRPHPATRFPYGYGFALAEIPVAPDRTTRVVMHAGLGYGGSALLQRLVDGDGVVVLGNNVGGLPPAMPEILPVLAMMPGQDGSAQAQSAAGDAPSPQHEQMPRADTLVLTNVTLIDGTGAPPRPRMTVLVHGDTIGGVFPVDETRVPASAEVLDLSGQYLIPGLINTHVHLPMIAWSRDSVAAGLERMLHAGVTTVREMAGDTRLSAELNRARLIEGASLPSIHYAVRLADPTFYEPRRDTNRAWIGYPAGTAPWAQAVTAETDLVRAVAMAAGTGATGLKLYTNLDPDVVRGLVAEAHRQGLKAWAHGTLFPTGPLEAIRSGIHGLSHICFLFFGLQPVVATSMAERVPFDPGLVDLEGGLFQELMREMRARDVVLDATARNAAQNPGAHAFGCTVDLLNRSLRAAHRAGVRISTGTDYVVAEGDPDPTLFTEIEYLVDAGVLSPLEAITAATLNGARAIGIEDHYGTIEVGKVADFVVLSGDPTQEIGALQSVVAVFKDGRQVTGRRGSDLGLPALLSDTLRYVEVVNGRTLGGWSTWRESLDTWGYASDRLTRFPRTDRLTLDAAGLPVRLETRGQIRDGVPWFERFERDSATARWSTPRERGEVAVHGPAFYAAIHPAHDIGVLARALLRQPSRTLGLLPEGSVHLESLGERTLRHDGRSRPVRLFAVHGLDLFPLYVWLEEDGTTFADDWTVREGWEEAFAELRTAMDEALDDHRRTLARELIPPSRDRALVIQDARLFDPATKTVREGMTIVVEGDRIRAVAAEIDAEVPPGADIIAADGRMVVPGLWDMHAHHVIPADGEPLWSRGFAPLHLAGGITTARDVGGHFASTVALRDAIERGEAVGARILMAGYMNGPAGSGLLGVRVENAAEARAAVDRFAELGFVQIKTYNELPADLVHVVIGRARERGLRVGGHVPFAMTAGEAVEAGYDELHHAQMTLSAVPLPTDEVIAQGETWDTWYQVLAELSPDSEPIRDLVRMLADSSVALDATLGHFIMEESPPEFIAHAVERFPATVARRLNHTVFSDWYVPTSPMARPAWERTVENVFGLVRAAHEAGVPIVVGTDTWAGFGLHHEMELLVRAGLPASDVLALATLGAARVMGMDDELGSVEPGKLADLILVDGDPTTDIRDIRRVVTVIKDGKVYDPAAIYRALGIKPCCEL